MIVLDASVVVELFKDDLLALEIRREVALHGSAMITPHLLDVEVISAVRNLHARRRIDSHQSAQFLNALAELPVGRLGHIPLLPRIWELRHNFTAYDAAYIALAEAADAVLYTCDAKLRTGHRAKVRLFQVAIN